MSSFKDTAMHGARQVKHWGFLAEKHGRALSKRTRNRVADVINPVRSHISPYSFDPSLYRRSFLVRPAPPQKEPSQLPRQVFMVWTGENDLTPARSRNLQATQEIVGGGPSISFAPRTPTTGCSRITRDIPPTTSCRWSTGRIICGPIFCTITGVGTATSNERCMIGTDPSTHSKSTRTAGSSAIPTST